MYTSQYTEKDLENFSVKQLKDIVVEDSIFNKKLCNLIRSAEKQGRTTIDISKIEEISVT